MRKILKIASGVLLGLLVVGAFEPTWLYLMSEGSGVAGEATVGPTCPGPVARGGEVCPPGHITMTAVVTRRGWPGVAAVIHTGGEGRFRLQLAPGQYTIHVLQSPWHGRFPYLNQSAIPVRVRARTYTPVTVRFWSGMQ
jgi:hypothetical protein